MRRNQDNAQGDSNLDQSRETDWFPNVKTETDKNIDWFPNVPRSEPGILLTLFAIFDEIIALFLLLIGIIYALNLFI